MPKKQSAVPAGEPVQHRADTPLLDTVTSPCDMKDFSVEQLTQLADEVRAETISAVSVTGGHLGAGLGVVELTVALHHLFDTPNDRIIWDVGHQAYPHKVLTERRDRIRTLRQGGGLSGFTKRAESEYDPFGAGHSSTSISAGLGMAVASNLKGEEDRKVIAVIGDGSISAGMAYEAMNNAGYLDENLIVILNDNDMSIAPPTGAMSSYLARLVTSKSYRGARNIGKKVISKLPSLLSNFAKRAEKNTRNMLVGGGTVFEELGFYYIGPVDGHDLESLVPVLKNVRDAKNPGPVLIHVRTEKGRGFEPAKTASDKCHAVAKFDVVTGKQSKPAPKAPTYTNVYADQLVKQATKDDKIVGITAAMPGGTGMDKFGAAFPDRMFDVGIAEQHAVTFAAGMAAEGMKPFSTIYSTFLQRGYDQVVHDVAIQKLPVRFAMDRAGLVGADGQTHAGSFDLAYLGCLPGMVIMAAGDEAELAHMVATAVEIDDRPSAFRYPRGEGAGVEMPEIGIPLEVGKGRIVRQGSKVALLSLGGRLQECLKAADELEARGLSTTVADARFAKPVDADLIADLAKNHEVLITIEEGSIGGFAAQVNHTLLEASLMQQKGFKLRNMFLPDVFLDHQAPVSQYETAGLMATHIVAKVFDVLGQKKTVRDVAKDLFAAAGK